MKPYTVALFGEAERGKYRTAYLFSSLEELLQNVGNAPSNSRGLYYAVQALLYHYNLIFFRVEEEGFSIDDYHYGIQLLTAQQQISEIAAFLIPGVGNREIVAAVEPLCALYHSVLVMTEADLYDYLTASAA